MEFLFIRHGQADYSDIDRKGFIGQGRALAPLSMEGIKQVGITAKNPVLKGSDLIISSPYTRALQSALIINQELNLDLKVEVDLHEWIPDIKKYAYKTSEDCFALYNDYQYYNGIAPKGSNKVWETKAQIITRVDEVLKKYAYLNKVIVVCHSMVIQSKTTPDKVKHAEIRSLVY